LRQKKSPQQPFGRRGRIFCQFLLLWQASSDNRQTNEINNNRTNNGRKYEIVRFIDIHFVTVVHPEPPQLFPKYIGKVNIPKIIFFCQGDDLFISYISA
jgi:hypothetical protein